MHKTSRITSGSLLHAPHERAHALRTYPGTPTAPLQGPAPGAPSSRRGVRFVLLILEPSWTRRWVDHGETPRGSIEPYQIGR